MSYLTESYGLLDKKAAARMEPPFLFNLWDVHYQRSLERTNIQSLVTRSLSPSCSHLRCIVVVPHTQQPNHTSRNCAPMQFSHFSC